MPVDVVLDGPRGRWRRAAWRRTPTILGALLLGSAALVVLPLIALTIAVVIYLFVWLDFRAYPENVWPDWFAGIRGMLVPLWLVALSVTAVGFPLGLRLVRENRNLVLFLRRFGYRPATQTVTEATSRLGDFWRVVTLDDDNVESLGPGDGVEELVDVVGTVGRSYRSVAALVTKAWKLVVWAAMAGLTVAVFLVTETGPDSAQDARWEALVDLDQEPHGAAALGARIAALVLVVTWALAAVCIAAWVVARVLSIPLRLVYGGVSRGVRAAADADELHVVDLRHITAVRQVIEEQRHRVFGPRLTVLTVNSAVWRQTVAGMAGICAVPLIDISEPTDNVLWEIEELVGRFGDRCVFIGAHGRLQELIAREPDQLMRRLSVVLDGRQVLAYVPGARGEKRFVRALGAMLERQVRRPLPVSAAS